MVLHSFSTEVCVQNILSLFNFTYNMRSRISWAKGPNAPRRTGQGSWDCYGGELKEEERNL